MTRGNQRDIDRQRAQNRKEKYGKEGKTGDPIVRILRYIHKQFNNIIFVST